MTQRSHHSAETTDARVIVRLRKLHPKYQWRYSMRRQLDALWPSYVAKSASSMRTRTVTWFTVDHLAAWRWTDSREIALPQIQHSEIAPAGNARTT
jgi:hypothetical protein